MTGTKIVSQRFPTPSGREIEVHVDDRLSGAWIHFDGHDRSLTLQVNTMAPGGEPQTYIGYRDGVAKAGEKLAVSVSPEGQVSVQLVLGEKDLRTFNLEELEALVAASGIGKGDK